MDRYKTMGILEIIAGGSQNKKPAAERTDFKGVDRRKNGVHTTFTCGPTFKTSFAIGPIEDWLKKHFEEEYRLNFQDISNDLTVKQIRVAFAIPSQHDAFKEFEADPDNYLKQRLTHCLISNN